MPPAFGASLGIITINVSHSPDESEARFLQTTVIATVKHEISTKLTYTRRISAKSGSTRAVGEYNYMADAYLPRTLPHKKRLLVPCALFRKYYHAWVNRIHTEEDAQKNAP
jgi:hypothetical protein